MKKLLAMILALLMIFPLIACSEPSNNDPKDDPTGTVNSDPTGTGKPEPSQPATKTIYIPLTQEHTVDGKTTLTAYSYDENNNLCSITITDSTGAVLQMSNVENDAYGQPLKITETQNGITAVIEYTYDSNGNILTQTLTQDGELLQESVYTYNADGQVLTNRITAPGLLQETRYTYENGLETRQEIYTNGELSSVHSTSYDDQGRIIGFISASPDGTVVDSYTCTWSEDGLVYTMAGDTAVHVITKDEHGNILRQESTYISMGYSYIIQYTYKAIEVRADSPRKK